MPDHTPDESVRAPGATTAGAPGHAADTSPPTAGPAPRRKGVMAVLLPALTFVIGLLLGAALVWAGSDRGEDVAADPSPTPSASVPTTEGTGRPDATVTVPGSCLDLADSAEVAADLVQEAATAAQDLDAAELSSIVRQMQDSRGQIQEQAGSCRTGTAP